MTDLSVPDMDAILLAAGEIGYDWDLQKDSIRWLGAWQKLFGEAAEPPKNFDSFSACICPDDRYVVFSDDGKNIDREYRIRLPDGNLVRVHERGKTEFEDNSPARQLGTIHIVDRQLNTAAHHELYGSDPLTGRFNRNNMLAQINRALEGKGSARRGAYLVIGIDKMSFVNEAIGTEAGDQLLRGVADRLAELMPVRALLGRVGGDMFSILLPEQLERDFQPLAERILQNFRDRPVETSTVSPMHITVSIGGVRLSTITQGAAEVMIRAEQALHDARQRGRDFFIEYQESPARADANRKTLEIGERIKRAFRTNGLRLAFQPVIECESGQVLFYEALVRMFDDNGKMITAADFVPVIEQMGMAQELDRHVLSLAIAELETWPELCLAINVSGLTAAQVDWPDHMRKMLGHRPDVAQRMIVEITETAAIVDVSETKRFVDSFRELGGQVALDDFGAGFTSIRHLRTLALSIMKIDKELLNDLLYNPEQQHIVRMLLSIAKGLGLKTVAEGVETEEIANWLRKEKVDLLQGYYFGKPSMERPWLELKGAHAPMSKAKEILSSRNIPVSASAPAEIRVASFI